MPKFEYKVLGRTYRAENGTVFTVQEIEPYPEKKISKRYLCLMSLSPGMLVSVPYRATAIPNITVEGGVVRLNRVVIGDTTLYRPIDISRALGIEKPFEAKSLELLNEALS